MWALAEPLDRSPLFPLDHGRSTVQRTARRIGDGVALVAIHLRGGEGLGWSPDGRISFRDFVTGTADWDIFAINPDGSNLKNLTQTASQESSWDWAPLR